MKDLTQWFLKITAYGDELLEDLQKLEGGWPERVLAMQHNWTKSTGAAVTFALEKPVEGAQSLDVFTTRPDTLFGVCLHACAGTPLVEQLIAGQPQVTQVTRLCGAHPQYGPPGPAVENLEKRRYLYRSLRPHPLHRAARAPVAGQLCGLADYGTGAVMGVPPDQRDFEFACKYGLPVKVVICPKGGGTAGRRACGGLYRRGRHGGSGPF